MLAFAPHLASAAAAIPAGTMHVLRLAHNERGRHARPSLPLARLLDRRPSFHGGVTAVRGMAADGCGRVDNSGVTACPGNTGNSSTSSSTTSGSTTSVSTSSATAEETAAAAIALLLPPPAEPSDGAAPALVHPSTSVQRGTRACACAPCQRRPASRHRHRRPPGSAPFAIRWPAILQRRRFQACSRGWSQSLGGLRRRSERRSQRVLGFEWSDTGCGARVVAPASGSSAASAVMTESGAAGMGRGDPTERSGAAENRSADGLALVSSGLMRNCRCVCQLHRDRDRGISVVVHAAGARAEDAASVFEPLRWRWTPRVHGVCLT
jgi:hypothetical protein